MKTLLSTNIKSLRKKKNMTLEELAEKVGTSKQTIQRYESGKISNIPSDKIELLAKYLDTTPAKLMGWEISRESESEIITTFALNLQYYMDRDNISITELAEKTNLDSAKIYRWIHGQTSPIMADVYTLKDYFHINVSDLIERTKRMGDPNYIGEDISEIIDTLIRNNIVQQFGQYDLNEMSEKDISEFKEQLLDSIKFFARRYKKRA